MTTTWSYIPVDADRRDLTDPDTVLGAKGDTVVHALTFHVPGVTLRRAVYTQLHDQIHSAQGRHAEVQDGHLCGVEHVEDIGAWQAPHTGRAELQKQLRRIERQHRRPAVIVHGWQHIGPCPTTTTTAAPTAENGART